MHAFLFRITSLAAALCSLSALSPAAQAASLYERTFHKSKGGSTCYARYYTKTFLRQNPSLAFTTIYILHDPNGTGGNTASKFRLRLSMVAKKDNQRLDAEADCAAKGAGFSCPVDVDDGGSFRILRAGKSIRVTTKRVYLQGSTRDVEVTSKGGKERSFTLARVPVSSCPH